MSTILNLTPAQLRALSPGEWHHIKPERTPAPADLAEMQEALAQLIAKHWPEAYARLRTPPTGQKDSRRLDIRFDDENGDKVNGFLIRLWDA